VANVVTVALDSNSLSALENVTVTVGAAITGTVTIGNSVTISSLPNVFIGDSVPGIEDGEGSIFGRDRSFPVSITDALPAGGNNIGSIGFATSLPSGTNRIGVVTIGAGTVTIGAGTAQIGSVTASISGTVPVSGTFWQTTQPVSLTSTTVTVNSLPSLAAGTNQIGSVTASISGTVPVSISSVTIGNSVTIGSCVTHGVTIANTVVTFTPAQGTTVANSNFTSTTASTSLVSADSGREVLTVFNEGAGNLHISPGSTCTTVAYQVRLSAGDYWECPSGQLTLAHTAVFATAGTARVSQTS
jgi:hypothetical protein